MPLYRNRETGIVQWHPTPGLGESFNSDEIDETGKPVIPLGTSKEEQARLKKLQEEPVEGIIGEPVDGTGLTATPDADSGDGKKKGDQ